MVKLLDRVKQKIFQEDTSSESRELPVNCLGSETPLTCGSGLDFVANSTPVKPSPAKTPIPPSGRVAIAPVTAIPTDIP